MWEQNLVVRVAMVAGLGITIGTYANVNILCSHQRSTALGVTEQVVGMLSVYLGNSGISSQAAEKMASSANIIGGTRDFVALGLNIAATTCIGIRAW